MVLSSKVVMRRSLLVLAGLLALTAVSTAPAWWVKGHATIAEAAASRLPAEMPPFFRAGGKHLGHFAGDPDRWKNRLCKHLTAAESLNHYIDLEDFEGKELPEDRNKAVVLLAQLGRQPEGTGLLPYALMEHFDRLTCAFYDYRQDPDNEAIRMKCLVYAGVLSHFTGDAAMPLHTTRDFDGRRGPDGTKVQAGIHAKIDAFPEKNKLSAEEICRGLEARPIEDVWGHVVKTIHESYKHIDRCYDLDKAGAIDNPTAESRAFILERCRVASQFTMDLWYNAWLRSAKMTRSF
jgi:hypothetical protein